jgi:hypothetical protein
MKKMKNWNIIKRILSAGLNGRNKADLPLPKQKNLLNVAFPAPKSPKGTLIQIQKIYFYALNIQWFMRCWVWIKKRFLCCEQLSTLFEFNRPISKKERWISKDFGKNGADFERFRMDFESCGHLPDGPISSNL